MGSSMPSMRRKLRIALAQHGGEPVAAGDWRARTSRAHRPARKSRRSPARRSRALGMIACTSVIDAPSSRAVERHVLDKLDKTVLDPVERTIMIKVFGIDI